LELEIGCKLMEILIVDDEILILNELSEILIDEGYTVSTANAVDEALLLLSTNHNVHLVLTDMKMMGKSGSDLIRTAKKEFPNKHRFIILSGHAGGEEDDGLPDAENIPFFLKPVDLDSLLTMIKNISEDYSANAK